MRSLTTAALFASVVAGPALADGAHLSGLPAALLSGAAAEGTQHDLAKPPALVVKAGTLTVALDKTTLAEIAAAFGGTIQHAADQGTSADWLCYSVAAAGPNQNIWFLSDGKAGGASHHVTLAGTVYGDPRSDCPAPQGGLTGLGFAAPVPGLGGSLADIEAAFGAVDARDGMVAYLNQGPVSTNGTAPLNGLNYLVKSGSIVGVAATAVDQPQ